MLNQSLQGNSSVRVARVECGGESAPQTFPAGYRADQTRSRLCALLECDVI